MAKTIYLEIDRSNGAILSFDYEKLQSKTSEFVEATEAELSYLNHLEDNVFEAGMVATLSDLQAYRARVKKIEQLKFDVAQIQGKIARAKIAASQTEAKLDAVLAKKDALLSAGSAKHGVTPAEYEAECIAQYKASQAGTGTPQTKSGSVRSEVLKQMQKHFTTK
ncbi:hypothetical protein [Pseudomonas umsongensis]|uniref:hypothetical protein n=1 Tax=Pseudomonas umsongensis TaxID=198618 RepID=UPI003D7FC16F